LNSEAVSSPNSTAVPLDPSSVQRVLLIRLRSIGDTVLMTPCLSALKAWRAGLEISVVSESLAAPLLEDHPLVDRLIVAEKSVTSRASLIAELRRARFDAAFNLHGGSTGTILARFSGARRSFGYGGLPLSSLLSDRAPGPDLILARSNVHSVEQQLALLSWSGVTWPDLSPRLTLTVSSEAEGRVLQKVQHQVVSDEPNMFTNGFACIVPGAAFESKRWTARGFAEVADHLTGRWNLPSLVIAGPGQEHLAREVASAICSKTPVLTDLSLKELVALLSHARIFVGNDSGPMHIAAALSRPLVVVWGSSDQTVWHPWTGAPLRVVGAGDPGHTDIKQISSVKVIAAVDEVLETAPEANHRGSIANLAQRVRIDT
jgi:lipopolysaccharide heptosyltransferase III